MTSLTSSLGATATPSASTVASAPPSASLAGSHSCMIFFISGLPTISLSCWLFFVVVLCCFVLFWM